MKIGWESPLLPIQIRVKWPSLVYNWTADGQLLSMSSYHEHTVIYAGEQSWQPTIFFMGFDGVDRSAMCGFQISTAQDGVMLNSHIWSSCASTLPAKDKKHAQLLHSSPSVFQTHDIYNLHSNPFWLTVHYILVLLICITYVSWIHPL